jgi:hypothetical protein
MAMLIYRMLPREALFSPVLEVSAPLELSGKVAIIGQVKHHDIHVNSNSC